MLWPEAPQVWRAAQAMQDPAMMILVGSANHGIQNLIPNSLCTVFHLARSSSEQKAVHAPGLAYHSLQCNVLQPRVQPKTSQRHEWTPKKPIGPRIASSRPSKSVFDSKPQHREHPQPASRKASWPQKDGPGRAYLPQAKIQNQKP